MTLKALKKKYVGNRAFYRMVLAVAVPIMIQNGITNFVSLLDNIMVGQTGTEPMSGVSIVNQLLFVYNLCIFGGLSGAGIFTAQYFGQGDEGGVRDTFRYKLWLAVIVTAGAIGLFLWKGEALIQLYLQGDAGEGDLALTLSSGLSYLRVMLLGLPAFMLAQTYTSTLRESAETLVPMRAGLAAVATNLVFNWLLIFGHLGFPRMGVTGAAVATVISRYVELLIVALWTHRHPKRCPWAAGIYRTLAVPLPQVKRFFVKGFPLLLNEALWAGGQAMLSQCYSVRGLNTVAALNIANTINNLFLIVFMTMGSSIAIIVGQRLGAGRMEEAKDIDNKMIAFSIACSVVSGLALFALCPLFPRFYNTSEEVRATAVVFMRIAACFMPLHAFMNAAYFTLRSGGKTVITFLFDSGFVMAVSLPIAFLTSRLTGLPATAIYALVSAGDLIKCVAGYIMVKRNLWIQNIVEEKTA